MDKIENNAVDYIAPKSTQLLLGVSAVVLSALLFLTLPAQAAKGGNGSGGNDTTYTVGGSVTGLGAGGTISLQLDGTFSESINKSNGPFTFAATLARRDSYTVTVTAQPDGVNCAVTNGSGTINKKDVTNVTVTCSGDPVVTTYSVGGVVTGLEGNLVLDNLGEEISLGADGIYVFPTELADGASYSVTVSQSPAGQSCSVVNSSGAIAGADVTDVNVTCETPVASLAHLEGAGDSIMRGYNASCTGNTGFFDLFCYAGGDQDQHSFLDGSSSSVFSLLDRYISLQGNFSGSKAASMSGSEMTALDKNNFATQAAAIVASTAQPTVVVVELGGNDLCNRSSGADLYSDEEWRTAVQAGLDVLVNQLPDGSTVYLSSVPRVQDLRSVGLAKQSAESGVNCESFWASYDVCTIATANDTNFDALQERQQAYNEILAEEAISYNTTASTTGVEVVAEYQAVLLNSSTPAVGNYGFAPSEINGGDCFHPSISGQNKLSEILWNNNPFVW
ncbi:SGNH/GDSL hydrolase family protein [Parahaliea maris]|uniref:SGNH/GDSL hydrolase family protein n=1 Tax=Parahaliea maris TaxID=2716870 RepID=A0A5C9A769_9GAMM|nr:SGNH/GDSL hydrolase family protein [Parahaliea maris]TXS95852.1 SGNH/GDSL hydrolase family protein [Parahaliea maris]